MQAFGGQKFNLTHNITHFSFGIDYPGQVNPLDGSEQIAEKGKCKSLKDFRYQKVYFDIVQQYCTFKLYFWLVAEIDNRVKYQGVDLLITKVLINNIYTGQNSFWFGIRDAYLDQDSMYDHLSFSPPCS